MKYNLKTLSLIGGLLVCGRNIYGMQGQYAANIAYMQLAMQQGRVIKATYMVPGIVLKGKKGSMYV